MKTIKICGVPEHFNMPWQIAIEKNIFSNQNIDLQWTNVPEGTGKMCQMLLEATTDIAVILTEGIFKDIINGNPSKIVQIYVESPLIWGIHVAANSNYQTIADLENKKVAISRLGSGSHLMAIVNAKNNNWDIEKIDYQTVNTIDGAVESLSNQTADYFMWEQFMTKPLVDAGIFRKIGTCPTPWSSFVIAVRKSFLEENPEIISKILELINQQTSDFKIIKNIDKKIASHFNQNPKDIQDWLSLTTWSQKNISVNQCNAIQNQLFEMNIIDKKIDFSEIIYSNNLP
jgi:ABC-type nitrate/sulfonate/bicarbonate transport system substrate-binding protein